jgi:hypothetical protein
MWPRVSNRSANRTSPHFLSMYNRLINHQMSLRSFRFVLSRKWNSETTTAAAFWSACNGSGTVHLDGTYSNEDALIVSSGPSMALNDTLLTTNDLHIAQTSSAIANADVGLLSSQIIHGASDDNVSAEDTLLGVRIILTLVAFTSEYI